MPTELVWSNQARTDLLEIYVMIGLEQPAAAERYFNRIESKADLLTADSDEVARVYRYEVARGFRDDVAHLSDLISPGSEAFWPIDFLALGEPGGQPGIAA